jgi:hypothetical protein
VTVRVHIERLVLEGLPVTAAQGRRVQAAVEEELGRLIETQGVSRAVRLGGSVPRLEAPPARVSSGSPRATGRAIAHSVYASIGTPK